MRARRAYDAAQPRHRVEAHQEVQIDLPNIHGVDFSYPPNRLDKWRARF